MHAAGEAIEAVLFCRSMANDGLVSLLIEQSVHHVEDWDLNIRAADRNALISNETGGSSIIAIQVERHEPRVDIPAGQQVS